MTNHIYGVVSPNGIHKDVSKTERGAKQYATKNGYTQVSIRYNSGYHVDVISVKRGNKWTKSTSK